MKTNLSAVLMIHNGEKIRYPWRQAIKSVMPVVDEVVIVLAGPNEDDTPLEAMKLAKELAPKVRIVYGPNDTIPLNGFVFPYYHPNASWPDTHIGLSALVNIGVEFTDSKVVFELQADEIFDEADYDELLRLPCLEDNYMAMSFSFRHYCGTFGFVFPFVYQRVVRAFRTDSDYHFVGDAVQAEGHGDVYAANVTVNHVGKVHVGREEQAAFKEYFFQNNLYAHGKCWEGDVDVHIRAAYEEGKLDFFKVFEATVKRGDVKEYSGPYCKYVREWAHELGVELP